MVMRSGDFSSAGAGKSRASYMRDWRRRRKKRREEALLWTPSADQVVVVEPHDLPGGWEAARLIQSWAAAELKVPTGLLQGEPMRLVEFQVAWLGAALAPAVLEAGLSMARKNGKSGLIAVVLLAYLVGPMRSQNWRAIVASLDGGLAKELARQVDEIAEASGLGDQVTVLSTPAPGRIKSEFGEVTMLAADKSSGHAVGADLAVIDEAGPPASEQARSVERYPDGDIGSEGGEILGNLNSR